MQANKNSIVLTDPSPLAKGHILCQAGVKPIQILRCIAILGCFAVESQGLPSMMSWPLPGAIRPIIIAERMLLPELERPMELASLPLGMFRGT